MWCAVASPGMARPVRWLPRRAGAEL